VVNLNDVPLEDAAYSTLGTGLNYAVAPVVLPIEDILSGMEKAVCSLPEEAAEDVRQENQDPEGLQQALRTCRQGQRMTVVLNTI
jgi:hypothetical protein